MHAPVLIATGLLLTLLVFNLAVLGLVVLAYQRYSFLLLLLVKVAHNLANKSEFNFESLLSAFAQPRSGEGCD